MPEAVEAMEAVAVGAAAVARQFRGRLSHLMWEILETPRRYS